VQQIILGGLTPVPPRHEISKTALGGVEAVPWQYCKDLSSLLPKLKRDTYTIAALELTSTSQNIFTSKLPFPLALLVGHEREGVEESLLQQCDIHLELPMHSNDIHSLNVSNATSVALYEAIRQFWYHEETN
jgi:23S rRNA (guanosine2251-2'-O)-methyltransferase